MKMMARERKRELMRGVDNAFQGRELHFSGCFTEAFRRRGKCRNLETLLANRRYDLESSVDVLTDESLPQAVEGMHN